MTTNAAVVAALAGCVLFSTGAVAQPYAAPSGPAPRVMPPYEAVSIARSEGLNVISRPVLRGRTYMLTALDREGRAVRVSLDAVLGDVIALEPVRPAGSSGYARGGRDAQPDISERQAAPGMVPPEAVPPQAAPAAGLPPYGDGEVNPPRPPRGMPAPSVAAAMSRTPLPRSRPLAAGPAATRAAVVGPDDPETTTLTEPVPVTPVAAESSATITSTAPAPAAPDTTGAIKPPGRKAWINPSDRPSARSPTDTPVQGLE